MAVVEPHISLLQDWDIVELKNGMIFMVNLKYSRLINLHQGIALSEYDKNLIHVSVPELNIRKILRLDRHETLRLSTTGAVLIAETLWVERGVKYYVPDFIARDGYVEFYWEGTIKDESLYENRLICKTEEEALEKKRFIEEAMKKWL